MEQIEINEKAVDRLKRKIILQENKNLKRSRSRRKRNVTRIDNTGKL